MTRLLLDQGLPYSTAAILNAQGWDVVHVADLNMQRASVRKSLTVHESKKGYV